MKEAVEGDGRTRTVGVVIGRLGGVAEGLRAAVEDAAGRGGCGGDAYDGEQADEVLPGGEEAGRGLGGAREGGPGRTPRRTRRHRSLSLAVRPAGRTRFLQSRQGQPSKAQPI